MLQSLFQDGSGQELKRHSESGGPGRREPIESISRKEARAAETARSRRFVHVEGDGGIVFVFVWRSLPGIAQRIFAAAEVRRRADAADRTARDFDLGRAPAEVVIEACARHSKMRRSHRFDRPRQARRFAAIPGARHFNLPCGARLFRRSGFLVQALAAARDRSCGSFSARDTTSPSSGNRARTMAAVFRGITTRVTTT
jgi:hypothetical protein